MGAWTTLRWDEPLRCGTSTHEWVTISQCSEFHYLRTGRYSVLTGGIWP